MERVETRIAGDAPCSTFADRGHEFLRQEDGSCVRHGWSRWPGEGGRENIGADPWPVAWSLVLDGHIEEALAECDAELVRAAVAQARIWGIDTCISRQQWEV